MRKRLPVIFFMSLLFVGIVGFLSVFHKRFDKGDIYPEYSTLRSDPLGSSILFETLQRTRGVEVDRNFIEFPNHHQDEKTTIVMMGVSRSQLSYRPNIEIIQNLIREGNHVFVTINPLNIRYRSGEEDEDIERDEKDNHDAKPEDTDSEDKEKVRVFKDPLLEKLGVSIELIKDTELLKKQTSVAFLGKERKWVSPLTLKSEEKDWHVLARKGEHPVILEKKFSRAKLTLCTDSYFLSNESLYKNKSIEIIQWVANDSSKVIFDETQHGVVTKTGVIDLVYRYRLQGFLIALLFVVILFIWHNSGEPFQDDEGDNEDENQVHQKTGLEFLLERSTTPEKMFNDMLTRWQEQGSQKEHPFLTEESKRKIDEKIKAYLKNGKPKEDLVKTYNSIIHTLKEKSI